MMGYEHTSDHAYAAATRAARAVMHLLEAEAGYRLDSTSTPAAMVRTRADVLVAELSALLSPLDRSGAQVAAELARRLVLPPHVQEPEAGF